MTERTERLVKPENWEELNVQIARDIATLRHALDHIFCVESAYELGAVRRQALYRIRCAIGNEMNIIRSELEP